jgi:hypothetical protein
MKDNNDPVVRIPNPIDILIILFFLIAIISFIVFPDFRQEALEALKDQHMGVCVEWVPDTNYSQCARWGGF